MLSAALRAVDGILKLGSVSPIADLAFHQLEPVSEIAVHQQRGHFGARQTLDRKMPRNQSRRIWRRSLQLT